MRVLVCGGRDYLDAVTMAKALDAFHKRFRISLVIHGAAPGADTMARRWATWRGIPHLPFPAEWKRLGPAAGPIRNGQMLVEGKPDIVVAFPGGNGTKDMRAKAVRAGVPVMGVLPNRLRLVER